MSTLTGNRELIRAINRSHILNTIKTHGPIGRAEIARSTGLSPATVTSISAELISQNLVLEKETGDSSGGRRPILLVINPKGAYVVGIKLTEDHAIFALTDLDATVIAKAVMKINHHQPDLVVEDLAKMVIQFIQEQAITKKQLLGVGIGLSGIVDAERGILRQSPIYGWQDLPLRNMLQRKLHIPTFIDNDVNTLTLTEKWFGHGMKTDNFLIVTVGRGVGMGIVVNDQVYHGQGGGAGEFGHTVIVPDGLTCACGKRGCLEAYVSDPGLINAAQEAMERGEITEPVNTIDELINLARLGDAAAVRIFARAGRMLGVGVANLIDIFDPKKIIISGEGTRAGDLLFNPMKESIQDNTMPGMFDPQTVEIAEWGDDAWARGAAGMVLREVFESPIHKRSP
jgi:glucokinase-like ROK family protein